MASHFLEGLKFTEQMQHLERKEVKRSDTERTGSGAGAITSTLKADYEASFSPGHMQES